MKKTIMFSVVVFPFFLGCIVNPEAIDDLNERQSGLDAKVEKLSQDVSTLSQELTELKRREEIYRTEIQSLERTSSRLSRRVDKLEKRKSTTITLKAVPPSEDKISGNSNNQSSNLYAIADSYYNQGNYVDAVLTYQSFIDNYPNDKRVADSYLKQGISLVRIGRKQGAKFFFRTLIDKFPESEEAKRAKEELKKIE